MGNKLTDKLPQAIDEGLMDIAQMYGEFDYSDIIKYSKIARKKDLIKMSGLLQAARNTEEETYDETIKKIASIIKQKINTIKLKYS